MMVFKAASLIATVILAVLALRHIHMLMQQLSAAKAKARVRPTPSTRPSVRLRQDPRTGVYYPES